MLGDAPLRRVVFAGEPRDIASSGEAAAATDLSKIHRTTVGATVEPVPPWIFSGCMMKANS
jgi:hypothetical protein